MTWKSILSAVALIATSASFASAQSFTVKDGGLGTNGRIFEVFVTPAVDGNSIALEIGLDGGGTVDSFTTIASGVQSSEFEDDGVAPIGNPGMNPFTGLVGEGIVIDGQTIFAALGGDPITGETLAYTFEINDPIAVFEVALPGVIAEDGVNNALTAASFGINGDFDLGGTVDTGDLGVFAGEFGTAGVLADFDGSGMVDTGDLGVFAGNFGLDVANNSGAPGAVISTPEPSSVILACLMAMVTGLSRRR